MTKLDTDNTGSIEQDELVDSLLVYVKAKVETELNTICMDPYP